VSLQGKFWKILEKMRGPRSGLSFLRFACLMMLCNTAQYSQHGKLSRLEEISKEIRKVLLVLDGRRDLVSPGR
jgi:hypothetical protein